MRVTRMCRFALQIIALGALLLSEVSTVFARTEAVIPLTEEE